MAAVAGEGPRVGGSYSKMFAEMLDYEAMDLGMRRSDYASLWA